MTEIFESAYKKRSAYIICTNIFISIPDMEDMLYNPFTAPMCYKYGLVVIDMDFEPFSDILYWSERCKNDLKSGLVWITNIKDVKILKLISNNITYV